MLSDGKELEGFSFALTQLLKFPGKFLQWLQNELARNFEPLKEELTCVFVQVVVLIFPNRDFLQ